MKYWLYWPVIAVIWLLAKMPRGFRHRLGWVFGILAWKLNHKRRAIVQINLQLCFPEMPQAERKNIAKQHFLAVGKSLIDLSKMWFSTDAVLLKDVDVEGWEFVEQAREEGKRLILHVAHSAGLEYGAVAVSSRMPGIGFYKPVRNKLIDWFVRRSRQRFSNVLVTREAGVRSYIKALRNGGILYYLSDEDLGPEVSEFVPLFSATKATLSTAGRIAALTDAAVFPAITLLSEKTGRYTLYIDPALDAFPGESAEQDALRLNMALEKLILRAPEQYMWFLKLFRTQPDGCNVYRKNG